jgi:fructose-1,6-bisphosphatase/inositol monophosphatase family enzyme
MTLAHPQQIGELLRTVASSVVMPRFQALGADEVVEKSAGELVTVADREAELALGEGLLGLLPEARLIGEEACAEAPELLGSLGDDLVWLIDPIDGTGNFAGGRPPFAIMVALLEDGVAKQSWILDPLSDTLWYAERGGGAYRNGLRLSPAGAQSPDTELTGILSEAFLPDERRGLRGALAARVGSVVPTQRCAGYEYPLVATGGRDFAIYWRTLPWDHAAGALLLTEAGGRVMHFDGAAYAPAIQRKGLILSRSPGIAARLLAVVADEEQSHDGP